MMLKFLMLVDAWQQRVSTREEKGATAVEYGLLVALIAVVIISSVIFAGGKVLDMYVRATQGW
jgi:pilus assembly protein Flp/PilA